jgi:hypothetical protein
MIKQTLGLTALGLAALQMFWAVRIYKLMRALGTPEERQANTDKAHRLNRRSWILSAAFSATCFAYLVL